MRKLSEIELNAAQMYGKPNMSFVGGAEIAELASALREAMALLEEVDLIGVENIGQWGARLDALRERVKP